MKMYFKMLALIAAVFIAMPMDLSAQYFGRNKARYENFDFKVYETPEFEFYHYLKNKTRLDDIVAQAEQWHDMHQHVLKDTINFKNPFILYCNHPDFQQTTTINGSVNIGTGGVTEAFKNRVVLPIAMTNQQTNHVIGHELVHAFQYDMIIRGDSTNIKNLANLPLWMVEGLAEYLSIGRADAHTAMWMRDAVLRDDIPKLKDLNNYNKYFPYRWGQVFWSFLTSIYGDEIIEPFFVNTARVGFDQACLQNLGVKPERLSEIWQTTLKEHFGQFIDGKKVNLVGKLLLSEENSGRINIAPVVSPDGKYVIFLSEKDLFGIDLFLADAQNGKIIKKITSTTRVGSHYDDFNYIESAGTWSPDSKQFAFAAVDKGDNVIIIKDAFSGKTKEKFKVESVPAFSNPIWSPDGKSIVIAGLVDGQIDLYQINIKSKKVTQLTNDIYTELLPNFSKDGNEIVFSTDELSMKNGRTNGKWKHNLAVLNLENNQKEHLEIFSGADNMNPVFNHEDDIYFVSNRDGFRNMYKYSRTTDSLFQMTNMIAGISGITQYASAISVSKSERRNRIVFTQFSDGKYSLYGKREHQFEYVPVEKDAVDMTAAMLPTPLEGIKSLVEEGLDKMDASTDLAAKGGNVEKPYRPKFKLDYIDGGAGVGIGVGNSNTMGTTTGLAGAVNAIFSDILGTNQLYATVALNGEIYDFGAQVAYINQKRRINWGVSASHIPNRTSQVQYKGVDTLFYAEGVGELVDHYAINNIRTFQEQIGIFGQYNFSQNLRFELGGAYSFYSNRVDRFDNYYDRFGQLKYQSREKVDLDETQFNLFKGGLFNTNASLVGDNSFMGMTAPLAGHRFRIGVDQYFGDLSFRNLTVDLRKYFRVKPVTFAFKAAHFGRYGQDANVFYPYYLGSPWYMRGIDYSDAQTLLPANGKSLNALFGNKMLLTNAEIRLPFTGPKQLALIKSKFFFSDLNLFVDGGMVWNDSDQFKNENIYGKPEFMFTAGASLRINLFGALVIEPYYAFPILKETKGTFGINIIPGW